MDITNHYQLSHSELTQFEANGFIGPFTIYSENEMRKLQKEIRALLVKREFAPYQADFDSPISNYDRHLDIDLLTAHVVNNKITDRVESILGENVLCWRSEFIPKYPGAEGTDWHQADTFAHASGIPQLVWPEDSQPDGCINVWTAFTEATIETGCLMFIPNTHDQSFYDESKGLHFSPETNQNIIKQGIPRGFNGYDYRELQVDPNWSPDESKAIDIEMKPGEFVIFKSRLLHASRPNRSKTKTRMGFVCRYVPGNVKVYPDTDYIEEFGGSFRLDNYGVLEVKGKNLVPSNRVKKINNAHK